ncbi:hypothetical protein [Thaumasiovibrio sp. DFM-14]|uniref:hypothetical protein n=1 Tax=Thaumasiovibrio sp. DFM-14 TaxID=3384792 RepID=UPI00399FAF63
MQRDPIGLLGGVNVYGYGEQKPTKFIDPTGELAILAPIVPIGSWIGANWGVIGAGVAAGAIMSMPGDTPTDEATKQAEYQRAKKFCDMPPTPGSNDCSTLSKQIDYAEQCMSLYEAWDAKWFPGRHSKKIQTWRNRLNNLKDKHNRECTNKCL